MDGAIIYSCSTTESSFGWLRKRRLDRARRAAPRPRPRGSAPRRRPRVADGLRSDPPPCSCFSDSLAADVLRAAADLGLGVPRSLRSWARPSASRCASSPSLTTVDAGRRGERHARRRGAHQGRPQAARGRARAGAPPPAVRPSWSSGGPPAGARGARVGRGAADPDTGSDVVPVEVHDLDPGGDEVAHELLLRVVARVDLGERPQLGVRAEDEVDPAAGPLDLAGGAVAALERLRVLGRRLSTSVPRSSRLTKKSLVSVPGRSVRTPERRPPVFAPSTRRPPTSTVISGALRVSRFARSTSRYSAGSRWPLPR